MSEPTSQRRMQPLIGPRSSQIEARATAAVAGTQRAPLLGLAFVAGDGRHLVDADGYRYLDMLAGASSAVLGYGRRDLVAAYATAANVLPHACFFYTPSVAAVDLAEALIAATPGDFAKRVVFGLSGSDAVDAAVKAAIQFTGRRAVLAFADSYHGAVGFSRAATGFPLPGGEETRPPAAELVPYPRRPAHEAPILAELSQRLARGAFAALVLEPVLGDGGNHVPTADFLRRVRSLCTRHGTLLIADEVQSGMGRTGRMWAIERGGVAPDLLCAGKGLGAGYVPFSAVVGRAEVLAALGRAQHVFTYSAHAASCAVVNAVIAALRDEAVVANAARIGRQLKTDLSRVARAYIGSVDTSVRGVGLMIGMEVRSPDGRPLAAAFARDCARRGLYVGYFGVSNEVLRLHPPLTLTSDEAVFAARVIAEVFAAYSRGELAEDVAATASGLGLGQAMNIVNCPPMSAAAGSYERKIFALTKGSESCSLPSPPCRISSSIRPLASPKRRQSPSNRASALPSPR